MIIDKVKYKLLIINNQRINCSVRKNLWSFFEKIFFLFYLLGLTLKVSDRETGNDQSKSIAMVKQTNNTDHR